MTARIIVTMSPVLVRTPDESQDDVIGIVSGPPPEINELAKSMN